MRRWFQQQRRSERKLEYIIQNPEKNFDKMAEWEHGAGLEIPLTLATIKKRKACKTGTAQEGDMTPYQQQ